VKHKSIFNAVAVAVVAVVFLMGFGVYAQTKSAPSVSTFKDSRDGKTYKSVKVGDKTWMAENLNFATKGSKCYENKDANCAKYGRLYDWETAQKACPAGWHLPKDDEWTTLMVVVGDETAGTKLKSTAGWNKNGNGTNDFGFSALPGGYGSSGGSFFGVGSAGGWWSVMEHYFEGAGNRNMSDNSEGVYSIDYEDGRPLFSLRCAQD